MAETNMSGDLQVFLDKASAALDSARHAAKPRGWFDRMVDGVFPKRRRRLEKSFEALAAIVDCLQQFSREEASRRAVVQDMAKGFMARHEGMRSQLAEQELLRARSTREMEERLQAGATTLKAATEHAVALLHASQSREAWRLDEMERIADHLREQLQFAQGFSDTADFTAFYLAFENRFRGSEEDIKQRLRVYLPRLQAMEIPAGGASPLVIDFGCGRGEWLQLLEESGVPSLGIDSSPAMIARCQAKGLPVLQADALEYLHGLPAASVRAVTAFHLIEHLPFPVLLALIRECHRVLVPGGLVIFETPSCHNLLVGSATFHLDPTHRHPLPAPLGQFALEHAGFVGTEVLFLHPHPAAARLAGNDAMTERFNEYFYGAQDYALIAQRARS